MRAIYSGELIMSFNETVQDNSNNAQSESGRSEIERRSLFKTAGAGLAGAAAMSALSAGGVAMSGGKADAQTAPLGDADIFNFALNLEYLEAEFYLVAATGRGLSASDVTGTGTAGAVTGGSLVPFVSPAIQSYAQRIAVDEQAHVRLIRRVLGASAVARPTIDLQQSFTTLAIAAGLIAQGQTFNPFADDVSFLLGSYIFEDVGVTAYAGAAAAIANKTFLTTAAQILAVEAYHAGAIRTLLSDLGAGVATNAISALRAKLSNSPAGQPDDAGTLLQATGYTNAYNFIDTDVNGLVYTRTTNQVLSIVYGGGAPGAGGLFFPAGLNGRIR
jgi:hypothetical protein